MLQIVLRKESCFTERSCKAETSQRVKGAEDGPEDFNPHGKGSVLFTSLWTLRKTPRLHQNQVFYSELSKIHMTKLPSMSLKKFNNHGTI